MVSVVKLAGGLVFGAVLSQFPEYSQQYVQRMGGALDELTTVVADFDISAKASGHTRDQALSAMTGSDFLIARQSDMTHTFIRFETLFADYFYLKNSNAFQRLTYVARMRDGEVAKGTAKDFKPAVPLTTDGLGTAGIGFLLGYGLLAGLLRISPRSRKRIAA